MAGHGAENAVDVILELGGSAERGHFGEGIFYHVFIIVTDQNVGNGFECEYIFTEWIDLEAEFFEEVEVFFEGGGEQAVKGEDDREEEHLCADGVVFGHDPLEFFIIDAFMGGVLVNDDEIVAINGNKIGIGKLA